ncbi:MAG: transcription termination factor Rho [Planctomyces sp.]|jgi:transcription termination factor Rho
MPTSSSDVPSEETSERPVRRRSTARSGTGKTRSTTRSKRSASAEVSEAVPVSESVSSSVADDFGDGVENPEKKPERRSGSRAAASRSVVEQPTERVRPSSEPVEREEPSQESRREAPRQLAFFSSDEIDFGDSEPMDSGEPGSEFDTRRSEVGTGAVEDDRRPRRRRRRRRRGGAADGRGPLPEGSRPPGAESTRPAPAPRPASQDFRPGGQGGRSSGGWSGPDGGGRSGGAQSRGRRGGSRNDDRSRRPRDLNNRDRNTGLSRKPRQIQPSGEVVEGPFAGVLELHPKGYGFLRDPKRNYAAEDSNPFVSSSQVEKYGLREGVLIHGDVGQGTRNQGPRLKEIETIDGFTPDEYANVKFFDNLTPINPYEQIRLETGPRPLTMRVMDLLCPIGKGQRALLVAPPRTGKTMLLQDIANSVSENHPEIHLMVLLIDERPEEVTEMRRLVKGEVISSSLDHDVESHVRISQLIIERGKRLAEEGKDVFILLDSITRMARAFNKSSNSGRTASGGLDIRALDIPKKLFGQARRFDEGGSLTVCGTALIDTGSRMDESIFQEFKGTGNMEMVLSRDLADRRIWPAIDVSKSGTRREEKILSPEVLEGTTRLRRSLVSLNPVEAMEQLTRTMEKFTSNAEFLKRIQAVL